MNSSGIRIVLLSGTVAVIASWLFDTLSSGVSIGSTTVTVGMVLAFGALYVGTHRIDERANRRRGDSVDRDRSDERPPRTRN